MAARANQILDENNIPVQGALVYVYDFLGNLAALTSDGVTPVSNPLKTDQFGNYAYQAAVAYYNEDIWYGGRRQWRENNVALGSPGADLALRTDLAATTGGALVNTGAGVTLQGYINNPGATGPITASFATPAFTTTAYSYRAQYLTNGATPGIMYSGLQGGTNATEIVTGAVIVPVTATNHQTNAVAAYIRSDRAQPGNGGDVAAYHQAVSNATNSAVFALNAVMADTVGFTGQKLNNEFDFNVVAADTTVTGANMVLSASIALTGTANAFRVAIAGTQGWTNGFVTADGAISSYAAFIGSQTSVTSTNRDSQKIAFVSYDSSNNRYIGTIFGDHLGGYVIRAGAAGGAFAVQDPTGTVNWFYANLNGFGYTTGIGGAVTQLTSKSTNVTLNKPCGQITMNNAALASGAKVSFAVADSPVAATDTVIANVASGGTANAYRVAITAIAAGSFTLTVENITAGSLSEAPVINFSIIKAVAS